MENEILTTYQEVRKILHKYAKDLIRMDPKGYEDLMTSYCRGHCEPSERKQKKDLKYLQVQLGL